jgi:hypothetical protein
MTLRLPPLESRTTTLFMQSYDYVGPQESLRFVHGGGVRDLHKRVTTSTSYARKQKTKQGKLNVMLDHFSLCQLKPEKSSGPCINFYMVRKNRSRSMTRSTSNKTSIVILVLLTLVTTTHRCFLSPLAYF